MQKKKTEIMIHINKIGYIRVSSIDQNTDRQEIALNEIGMSKIFIEKISGKNTNRLELKKMLEYVREGDILYKSCTRKQGDGSNVVRLSPNHS